VTLPFQRARRPEQIEARRAAIRAAARDALAGKAVAEVTLGDISARVGLAKSNVLRYFDSREAVLLDLLDEEFGLWLGDLHSTLGEPAPRTASHGAETRLAATLADSLAGRALFCDLLAAMAGVLERNIGFATARAFKQRTSDQLAALGGLIHRQLPWIDAESAAFVGEAIMGFTAGTYPFSTPSDPVRLAITELGLPDPRQRFTDSLRTGVTLWLIGASVAGAS